ncbi:MAG TPA: hypothetical protein VLW44_21075 [Streptosporangiaceae bacterium]|nr:hypothetical protein [Streptosporangiaceae bacterium]
MPVPSTRLKDLNEGTIDHHASQRWPALEEVTISWRGSYGYLTGHLSDNDDETIELCRIQHLGDPDDWVFAILQDSTGTSAGAVLLDGTSPGTPPRPSIPPAPSTSPTPANPARISAGLHQERSSHEDRGLRADR